MTIQERLDEAEAAYHDLMTNQAVVEIRDQNGETIKYSPANANKLATYIQTLKQMLGGPGCGGSRPMRFYG